ncbi:hypothetical protein HB770_04125 [Rhizobium leguminosarum bv. viciae]|uniref:Uncharacterized protein n=1 Tax=Rhizobium leguminosarum bv. viciae TaxID=387 RepID=A0A7G6RHV1_RHILV|nr:hypothetical protein HB770_04125 [Rhizobium leguminosarum bv. viciae]
MAITYMNRVAAAFILSTENDRSYDSVLLKQATTEYDSGEVVVAEYVQAVPGTGAYVNATGKYVKASAVAAALVDYPKLKVGFVVRPTDAREGDIHELVVNVDAEIRVIDTNLSALPTTAREAITEAVEAAGNKLR